MKRFPQPPPLAQGVPYFWGGVALNWPSWQVPSLIGLLVGDRIPPEWGLGFAGTLALLGLTFSLLHDRSTWIAAGGGRRRGGGRLCAAAQAEHPGGDRRRGGDRPADRPHARSARCEPEEDLT